MLWRLLKKKQVSPSISDIMNRQATMGVCNEVMSTWGRTAGAAATVVAEVRRRWSRSVT